MNSEFGSAYGQTANVWKEETFLTEKIFGTVVDELLRQNWQPTALPHPLTDFQKPAKIMHEDEVFFKDKNGSEEVLDRHCWHWGASLEYRRVEPEVLRRSDHC